MLFEFIKRRDNEDGFETNNIQDLFQQLEASGAY
jgi:4-hydroxyphenylpyruvate dioxygenase-like putative hemolysin